MSDDQLDIRGEEIQDIWINGFPIGRLINSAERRISELEARVQELEEIDSRVQMLEQDVAHAHSADGGEEFTKKELAKAISRNEAVRRAGKGIYGGAVDYPTVRDIADRDYGERLETSTVYDAWDTLASEWSAFSFQRGESGPHSEPNKLTIEADRISPSLQEASQEVP